MRQLTHAFVQTYTLVAGVLTMQKAQTPKRRVFLSHSSVDKPFVRLLAADITDFGIDVVLDELELDVAESLVMKISEAIQESAFVVACLSPASIGSEWVRQELSIGTPFEMTGGNLVVLPLLLDGLSNDQIPAFLIDRLYADFRGPEKYDSAFLQILRRISLETETIDKVDLLSNYDIAPLPIDAHRIDRLIRIAAMPGMHDWVIDYLAHSATTQKDPTARYWYYLAAGKLGGSKVQDIIEQGLKDTEPFARKGALHAARQLGMKIDKTAERGIIHKNQASRRKSSLMERANKVMDLMQIAPDVPRTREANAVEAILDRAWLDEGLSSEELHVAKQMAEIEAMLLAAGHDLKTVYRQWENKTSAQIIAEYATSSAPLDAEEPKKSTQSDWLPATFKRLISKSLAGKTGKWVVLHVSALLAGGQNWQRDLEIPLTERQARDFRKLTSGTSLAVRLALNFRSEQIHAELIDFRLSTNTTSG